MMLDLKFVDKLPPLLFAEWAQDVGKKDLTDDRLYKLIWCI